MIKSISIENNIKRGDMAVVAVCVWGGMLSLTINHSINPSTENLNFNYSRRRVT